MAVEPDHPRPHPDAHHLEHLGERLGEQPEGTPDSTPDGTIGRQPGDRPGAVQPVADAPPDSVWGDPHGRTPLAVVVVDGAGRITHWSAGAGTLFGVGRQEAEGRQAVDILPVSGADDLDAEHGGAREGADPELGPLDPEGRVEFLFGSDTTELTRPTAGRYWTQEWSGERGPRDVLWWAYPLLGPGGARMLLLAADAGRLAAVAAVRHEMPRLAPGFAGHAELARAEELARRLPEALPDMSAAERAAVADQVLRLGCPVLDFSRQHRVPVTPA
ncbi:PAS domain-containing protein [Streptomyces sp. B6B3]|uniref:PAS domain-containing protein n=1 Tax=Streptomyces sp. B6B3 TaxID=3153570 RepID=UPI00325E198A